MNKNVNSHEVIFRTKHPSDNAPIDIELGLSWPEHVYSLSHVALPFPGDDPLYGDHPKDKVNKLHLGDIALRGEKGVLQIPASDMLRQRWNPFYPYVESRILEFFGLNENKVTTNNMLFTK